MIDGVRHVPPGDAPARQGRGAVFAIYWSVLGILLVVAAVVTLVATPGDPAPPCPRDQQCPGPPPTRQARLATWARPGLGIRVLYPTNAYRVHARTRDSLQLVERTTTVPDGVHVAVWITVVPAPDTSAADALRTRQRDLAPVIVGLVDDDDPATSLPQLRIGRFDARGGSYRGLLDSPQGPTGPTVVTIAAATNGHATAVISHVISGTDDASEIARLRAQLAPVLTTFDWDA